MTDWPILEFGFGRLIDPDPRDRDYPITALAAADPGPLPPQQYWWKDGWYGNQGADPHCVSFAWAHWLNDGPHPYTMFGGRRPGVDTTELYCEAQKIDPWDGDCDDYQYDGTSIRAAAKIMRQWGLIDEYRWAFTVEEAVDWLARSGTIIMGSWWYESMSYPNADGVIGVAGQRLFGHAYVLNGVDTETELVRFKNSWNPAWGQGGHAFMPFGVMEHLLAWSGELCIPIAKT